MTYYDAAMAGIVVAGMVWGAWRGITWQVASIASLVLGYSVASPVSAQLAPQFPGEPVVARALAMLVVYAAVSGGVFLAAWIVRTTLRKLQFEAFDRHLGMILGGLEGCLIGMVATLFVVSLAPRARAPIFSSPTGRVVGQVMATLGPVLPSEARTVLAPFWDGDGSAADTLASDPEARPGLEPMPSESRSPIARPDDRDRPGEDGRGTASLRDLVEKEEAKLGRAIVETAEKELQQVGTGANGRSVERR